MEENHKKYYRLSLYLFILGFLSILILIFSVLSMVLFFTSHNQGSAVGGGDQTPDIIRNFVFFFAFVSPISFITSFIFRVLAHKPLRQWYDFISLFLVSIFVSLIFNLPLSFHNYSYAFFLNNPIFITGLFCIPFISVLRLFFLERKTRIQESLLDKNLR